MKTAEEIFNENVQCNCRVCKVDALIAMEKYLNQSTPPTASINDLSVVKALKDLVALKKHKDEKGEDFHYNNTQSIYWDAAEKALLPISKATASIEEMADIYVAQSNYDKLGDKILSELIKDVVKEAYISGAPSVRDNEDGWVKMRAKYNTYISNIQWHIKTNKPVGESLKECNDKLDCYIEIVKDLTPHPMSK